MEGARSLKKEKNQTNNDSDLYDVSKVNYHNIGKEIKKLEKLMKSSAKDLDFEQAAKYRDLIKELKEKVLINKAWCPKKLSFLKAIIYSHLRNKRKSLIKILQEPKNSLTKQYQELFKLDGSKLTFKENALKEIALKAIRKKTGARGLRSILENILLKTMYDLPSQEDIDEVIVDASAAKGQSQPILVHAKGDNKSKSNKTTAA